MAGRPQKSITQEGRRGCEAPVYAHDVGWPEKETDLFAEPRFCMLWREQEQYWMDTGRDGVGSTHPELSHTGILWLCWSAQCRIDI